MFEEAKKPAGPSEVWLGCAASLWQETVTRLFADLKRRQILQGNGSTLLIRNKAALRALAITQLRNGEPGSRLLITAK